ncbi:MAG: tetratricopeptide repeat protein, partial [Candidatus Zixiibacteriota bacterium]
TQMLAMAMIIVFLAGIGVTGEEGKIPITTSSEKAKEYFLKGRDLTDKLRNNESREYFEKAVAEDPNFAIAYLNLAFVQPTAAGFFTMFDKARALADKVSEGERLWILATEAGNAGQSEKQLDYMQQLVKAYPGDERAWTLLGNVYFGRQDYAKAIETFDKATAINPDFSQPYNQMGYAHRFLENYDSAEKAFKKYIELIPDDPNPYDSYAELLMKMGKHEKSMEYYKKALDINPRFINSYIGIATDLNCMGKHNEARKELQKLYDSAANNGERRIAHFGKVVSYVDEGLFDKALEEMKLQYSLAEQNNDIPAMAGDHITIGNIMLEQGKYKEARDNFEKALSLIKGSNLSDGVKENAARIYLYNIGRVDAMSGNLAAAEKNAAELLTQAEGLKNVFQIRLAHELAGIIALQKKDYATAVKELEQSNRQNPYNCYRMVMALEGTGETEKAREMCNKACHFNSLNDINYAFIKRKAEERLASM